MEKAALVFVGIIAAWWVAHLFVKSRSDDWWREHPDHPKKLWAADPFHKGGTIDAAINLFFVVVLFGVGIASCTGIIDLSD